MMGGVVVGSRELVCSLQVELLTITGCYDAVKHSLDNVTTYPGPWVIWGRRERGRGRGREGEGGGREGEESGG